MSLISNDLKKEHRDSCLLVETFINLYKTDSFEMYTFGLVQ